MGFLVYGLDIADTIINDSHIVYFYLCLFGDDTALTISSSNCIFINPLTAGAAYFPAFIFLLAH